MNDTSITVTGRTYPLELFFAQLGFDKEGDAWIFLPTADKTIQNVHQNLNGLVLINVQGPLPDSESSRRTRAAVFSHQEVVLAHREATPAATGYFLTYCSLQKTELRELQQPED